jgi:hypothetical protein
MTTISRAQIEAMDETMEFATNPLPSALDRYHASEMARREAVAAAVANEVPQPTLIELGGEPEEEHSGEWIGPVAVVVFWAVLITALAAYFGALPDLRPLVDLLGVK